jgi:flagellar protein FlaJ
MKGLALSDVFPRMSTEARLVVRDVEIFGMNPNEAMERLASLNPSRRFASYLTGYTSKSRSGGDVATYLTNEGGTLLRQMEDEWVRYVARVGIIGSLMITLFGVVPLLLMVMGVFSPGFSITGLVLFTALGVPVSTVGLLYLAGQMQPIRDAVPRGRAAFSLVLAAPGLGAGVYFGQLWMGIAAFLVVTFGCYGVAVRKELAEATQIEAGLSGFLNDLLEFKRQDYDLARAVVAIQRSNQYNGPFDRILATVARRLRAGIPLDEIGVECRSRLVRLNFLLLGQMSRSGGGTVETVYQVANFSERMREMRRNAAAEMKPYLILSYVSPLLLAFGITFVGGVLSSFGGRIGVLGLKAGSAGSVPPAMGQVSDILIVVSAAALGLIGAKISDFTARSTLMASVNVALAAGAISAMALLSHIY